MEASSRGNAYVKINGLWVIASLGSDPDSSKGKFRDNRDEPSHQDNSQRLVFVGGGGGLIILYFLNTQ